VTVKHIMTRFKAYSLGSEGGSYSYYADGHFTLVEARVTNTNYKAILAEMAACGKKTIDTLHITSWDVDHCKCDELEWILKHLRPTKIEYPGYPPHHEESTACLQKIQAYQRARQAEGSNVATVSITPDYINGLELGSKLGYQDIVYHPRSIYEESNDNSTVKMFRRGSFNVASLGDVEHDFIGAGLRRCSIFCSEIDVLILPHHGSEHSVLSRRFLREVQPQLGVCSNDYDDKHGHPDEVVVEWFREFGIPLVCTKTGDVLVESMAPHSTRFQAWNFHHDQTFNKGTYVAKKARLMAQNEDSIRNRYAPSSRPVIRL
jgi:competence protein ComEC